MDLAHAAAPALDAASIAGALAVCVSTVIMEAAPNDRQWRFLLQKVGELQWQVCAKTAADQKSLRTPG
jgi:hypothetical protein